MDSIISCVSLAIYYKCIFLSNWDFIFLSSLFMYLTFKVLPRRMFFFYLYSQYILYQDVVRWKKIYRKGSIVEVKVTASISNPLSENEPVFLSLRYLRANPCTIGELAALSHTSLTWSGCAWGLLIFSVCLITSSQVVGFQPECMWMHQGPDITACLLGPVSE